MKDYSIISGANTINFRVDDDAMNKSIEDVKALVAKAKEINREKNADICVIVENPDSYMFGFAGQAYEAKLSIKEADRAIDKIKTYLDHDNLVKVRIFKASGKSDLQRAMDREAFVNNRARRQTERTVPGNDRGNGCF